MGNQQEHNPKGARPSGKAIMAIISKASLVKGVQITSYWTGSRWVVMPELAKVFSSLEEAQEVAIAIVERKNQDDVN